MDMVAKQMNSHPLMKRSAELAKVSSHKNFMVQMLASVILDVPKKNCNVLNMP